MSINHYRRWQYCEEDGAFVDLSLFHSFLGDGDCRVTGGGQLRQ